MHHTPFKAPWRVGDAVVGRGNAGWTTSEWTSLPMQELLIMAVCRKHSNRIAVESSVMSTDDPVGQGIELN